jgi:hypothetical protein
MSENERVIVRRRPDGEIEIELTGTNVRYLPKVVDALQNSTVAAADMELNETLGLDVQSPSDDEGYAFIKALPNYQHSIALYAENFFQKPIHASKDDERQNALYMKIMYQLKRIREKIEKEENGRFLIHHEKVTQNGRSHNVWIFQHNPTLPTA